MTAIQTLTIEAPDPAASGAFYEALGLADLVHVAPTTAASEGFRGFVLGLVTSQPAMVDALAAAALTAGGTPLARVKRSLWGYGGAFLSLVLIGISNGLVAALLLDQKASQRSWGERRHGGYSR